MGRRIVTTLEVKNISNQLVVLNVKALSGSSFFEPRGGTIQLKKDVSFEAEESRFDRAQVTFLRRKKTIETQTFSRAVDTIDPLATDGD